MTWAVAIVVGAIGATIAVLAWQLANARAERDAAIVEASAAEERAEELEQAARQERERREGVSRVLHTDLEAARRQIADLVRGNPELAREYVRGQLRELAAPGAGPHDEVPGGAAAPPAGGDRGGGR